MPKNKKREDFTKRLLGLVSEPKFVRFENMLSEPNIFRIVGRTHYERWHSSFLGWLLDPNGSHLLSDYVLRRFLFLLLDERCLKADNHNDSELLKLLPTLEFLSVEVIPNEFISNETGVDGVGRFDIFLTGNYITNSTEQGNINVLLELKIDSKTRSDQSKKYADWLVNNHRNDINLLIYLLPTLLSDSKATVGDNRWYCIDYQLLNDKLLIPILDHPNLNEKVKPFLVQYMKNLKYRHKGIKMAITNEEKQLARNLYEKYSDVFDAIYDALQATDAIDYSISDTPKDKGRAVGKIAVKIDNKIFVNDTVRKLYKEVLSYIVDKRYILKLPLPWGKSSKRYIMSDQKPPVHPSGREFFYPVKYKGYALETHYARERAMKVLDDLCKKLELDFEAIEV